MGRRFRKQPVIFLPDRTATLRQARRLVRSEDCTATIGAKVMSRMLTPGSFVVDAKRSQKVVAALAKRAQRCEPPEQDG